MDINLLVGGPEADLPEGFYRRARKMENWVGADKGAVRLVKKGIIPDLAVGDFDSSSAAEIAMVEKTVEDTVIDPLKDDITDTEMALRYIKKKYQDVDRVTIYGATGARLDQLLANIFFILKPEFSWLLNKAVMIDRCNNISFYRPGSYRLRKIEGMKYLAFVPLIATKNLTLVNEKYRLDKADFDFPISLSSNEFVGDSGDFSFTSGVVIVIQSHD